MKLKIWAGIVALSLFLHACGSAPAEPTIDAESAQASAIAAASTMIVETQAAVPTITPIPPTDTPSPTALPTDTPLPTETGVPVTPSPTADPCNKPLTSWQGPSAQLSVSYEYSPQSKDDKVVLSLWVMTDLGECGFLSSLSTGPVGQYSAAAYVDGEKDFKVFGGFRITEANWKIVVRNDSIIALGSCYPNC